MHPLTPPHSRKSRGAESAPPGAAHSPEARGAPRGCGRDRRAREALTRKGGRGGARTQRRTWKSDGAEFPSGSNARGLPRTDQRSAGQSRREKRSQGPGAGRAGPGAGRSGAARAGGDEGARGGATGGPRKLGRGQEEELEGLGRGHKELGVGGGAERRSQGSEGRARRGGEAMGGDVGEAKRSERS